MKQLLLFVQDPNALKNWSKASDLPKKVLYTLDIEAQYPVKDVLLLVQLQANLTEQKQIESLIKRSFKVLLFSNLPTPEEGVAWFQKGIKGYLNTFTPEDRITQAIEAIGSGNVWLGQTVMQSMIQAVTAIPVQRNDGWKGLLTEREIETTEAVLQGNTNQQIAQQMNISERTVKAHMHNILEKLNVKDRLGLVLKIQNW